MIPIYCEACAGIMRSQENVSGSQLYRCTACAKMVYLPDMDDEKKKESLA